MSGPSRVLLSRLSAAAQAAAATSTVCWLAGLHNGNSLLLSCPATLAWLPQNRSVATWAIAVTFFNRFYTRKSMKKNNTFVSGRPSG